MPIPNIDSNTSDLWMFTHRRIGKQEKISVLPRRCYLSGKSLWLRKSICVTSMVTGPGEPMFQSYWCDPKEFLIFEIRR